jgi:hypothetical protein
VVAAPNSPFDVAPSAPPMAAAFDGTVMAAMAIEAIGEPDTDAGHLAAVDISASQARGFLAHGPHLRLSNCHL